MTGSDENLRVLLVENDASALELIRDAVASQAEAIALVHAETLEAACNELASGLFDAILLELSLQSAPPERAVATIGKLSRGAPIIVLADAETEDMAVEVVGHGAQEYLLKRRSSLEPILGRSLRYAIARQQTENALRESEYRFRRLVEDAPDLVFRYCLQPDRRFDYVNQATHEALGYSVEELNELVAAGRRLIVEEGRTRIDEMLAGLAPFGRQQLSLYAKDGQIKRLEANLVPIRGPEGEVTAIEGIARDVTAQWQAEQKLATTQQQLQQAQKMEAIGQMAGGIAHDFNNLLTAIRSFGNYALESLEPTHPARKDMEEVLGAAGRAGKLTEQLLAFSRRRPVTPKVLEVNDAVKSTANLLNRTLTEGVEIRLELWDDPGATKIDAGALEQILMNLALNARDAMKGSGVLTFRTWRVRLQGDGEPKDGVPAQPGDFVGVSVTDTGTGMSEDVKAHLFEPFFTTKEVGRGTGLGLATCYGLVTQAGGHITVDSESGQGAKFHVYLPAAEAPRSKPLKEARRKDCPGNETILVVEDDEQVRKVSVRSLQRQGYKVHSAGSAEEALELVERGLSDLQLVLSDVVMPRMTGRELVEELQKRFDRLAVLYMSGYTRDVIARHGVVEEGIELLQKPFDPATLTQRVRTVLDGREGSSYPPRTRLQVPDGGSQDTKAAAAGQDGRRPLEVLVVDDNAAVTKALSRQLGQRHSVTVAHSAREAIGHVKQREFDVVLCDMIMPEMGGRELLGLLREQDPKLAERVVFMTGASDQAEGAPNSSTLHRPVIEKGSGTVKALETLCKTLGD